MIDHPRHPASPAVGRRTFIVGGAASIGVSALRAEVHPAICRTAPDLDRIVAPDARVDVIATGIRWAEGPVWVKKGRYLLFSDPPANVMYRWQRGGTAGSFLSPSGAGGTDPSLVREPGSNGLALDDAGRLLIANSGGRSIDRLDLATKRRHVLVDRYRGKRFNSPNDMHVARSGAIYFTDPPYGFAAGDDSPLKEQPHNGVYRWAPGGELVLIDASLSRPNGIAMSPDEGRLYVSVSDGESPCIMLYDLDAHGMPVASRVWFDAKPLAKVGPGLPDGIKIGCEGTLFCSLPGGMMILTPEGERLGLIISDGPISNCAFGEGGRTLFMTSNHRVLSLPLAHEMG